MVKVLNDKKAWIKIAEAGLAIMLILGLAIVLLTRQVERPDIPREVYKIQHQILEEAADNETIRNATLENKTTEIKGFIGKRLAGLPLNFTINICNATDICLCPEGECPPKDIYVDNIIISATLERKVEPPLKLTLFVWIE